MVASATLSEIKNWPVEDRLELVFAVWDSIDESSRVPPVSEGLRAELDRRIAAYEANPSDVLTWEQIEASLDEEP